MNGQIKQPLGRLVCVWAIQKVKLARRTLQNTLVYTSQSYKTALV